MVNRRILVVVPSDQVPTVGEYLYILYGLTKTHRPTGFGPWKYHYGDYSGTRFWWRQSANEDGDEFWIRSTGNEAPPKDDEFWIRSTSNEEPPEDDGQLQNVGVEMLSSRFFEAGAKDLSTDKVLGVLHCASTKENQLFQRFIDSVPKKLYGRVADLEHLQGKSIFDAVHDFIDGTEMPKTFQELWGDIEGKAISKAAVERFINSI